MCLLQCLVLFLFVALGAPEVARDPGSVPGTAQRSFKLAHPPPTKPTSQRRPQALRKSPPSPDPKPSPAPLLKRRLRCKDVPFDVRVQYLFNPFTVTNMGTRPVVTLSITLTRLPTSDAISINPTNTSAAAGLTSLPAVRKPAAAPKQQAAAAPARPTPAAGGQVTSSSCAADQVLGEGPVALRIITKEPILCQSVCFAEIDGQSLPLNTRKPEGLVTTIQLGSSATCMAVGDALTVDLTSFVVEDPGSPGDVDTALFGQKKVIEVAGINATTRSFTYRLCGGSKSLIRYSTCQTQLREAPRTTINGTEPGPGSLYDACYPSRSDTSCLGALTSCGFKRTNLLAFARRNQPGCNACKQPSGYTPPGVQCPGAPPNKIATYCCAI